MSEAPDRAALRAAYDDAVIGTKLPSAIVTRGAVLNCLVGAERYDPHTVYLLTEHGIVPVDWEGED